MRFGTGKILGANAPVLLALALAVPAASGDPEAVLSTSIHTATGRGAAASVPLTYLTINDLRSVDNRITVFTGPTGRLTLVAPEGLDDPDGPSGISCQLDNAQPGQSTATQVSCLPDYVQVIVGDLGGGNDSFTATPDVLVMLGSVLGGQQRPLAGGPGQDRIVAGGGADFLEGGPDPDTLLGNAGEDLVSGSGGRDSLGGGAARDVLYGGGSGDLLNGGSASDLCSGGGGHDSGRACEISKSIP
jgi:Ca2+-binding RTX toxin-like protein